MGLGRTVVMSVRILGGCGSLQRSVIVLCSSPPVLTLYVYQTAIRCKSAKVTWRRGRITHSDYLALLVERAGSRPHPECTTCPALLLCIKI